MLDRISTQTCSARQLVEGVRLRATCLPVRCLTMWRIDSQVDKHCRRVTASSNV